MYRRKDRKTPPLFPELFLFGGKGALVHVGRYMFLDHFEHRAFAGENLMAIHVSDYVSRFGKLPPNVTADTKY